MAGDPGECCPQPNPMTIARTVLCKLTCPHDLLLDDGGSQALLA